MPANNQLLIIKLYNIWINFTIMRSSAQLTYLYCVKLRIAAYIFSRNPDQATKLAVLPMILEYILMPCLNAGIIERSSEPRIGHLALKIFRVKNRLNSGGFVIGRFRRTGLLMNQRGIAHSEWLSNVPTLTPLSCH